MSDAARTPTRYRNSPGWMARRILLAISLMVGFYVLALAIVIGLLWIPYAEWAYVGRIYIKPTALCIGAAFAILWALVPRPDRFEPPGPHLEEAAHPRLFEIIHQTAVATGQRPPEDVYLLNEVNAWVTHRGGTMGFGSHRVMGIGLPLLQAVSIPEFTAIIAHEFGHYWSGDVTLGPWIYKTRATIGRTIAGVRETFVQAPFLWYGRQFLKLTHAVSRQQEFIADEVAARVAGTAAMANALRRVTSAAPLFSSYVNSEVMPVLRAGFLPPVAQGFDAFLKSDHMATASEQILKDAEDRGDTDPFDTHPTLRDRLAALTAEPSGALPAVTEPASLLLNDPEAQGRALILFAAGQDRTEQLKPIAWDRVGESVIARNWRAVAERCEKWLLPFTADGIPVGRREFIRIGSGLVERGEENVNGDERVARATYVLGARWACCCSTKGGSSRRVPVGQLCSFAARSKSMRLPRCAPWPRGGCRESTGAMRVARSA